MTRIDSVRHAADVTKDSVRHAAEVAAPYAGAAVDSAVVYGRQAGAYGRQAGALARQQYDARLAARLEQAREQAWAAMPPKAATAVETAARRTREGAKAATEYTAPKVGTAIAATRGAAGPAKDELVLRGGAAIQALRGQVSAKDIDRLVQRRLRRERAGRVTRDAVFAAVVCAAGVAVWKWWARQSSPEWLVEPSEATEVDDRASMNGSGTGSANLTVVDPLEPGAQSVNGVNGSGAKTERIDKADGTPGAADQDADAQEKHDSDRRKGKRDR